MLRSDDALKEGEERFRTTDRPANAVRAEAEHIARLPAALTSREAAIIRHGIGLTGEGELDIRKWRSG